MQRHFALIALFLCALAWRVHAAEPLPVAGRVDFVAGDVRFVDDARRSRTPVKGDTLLATETVVTGRTGEIHLDMEDGGYLAVRSNSSVRVKEYRAKGDAQDRSVLQLLVGSLRAFTGWIPRLSPKSYRIETLTATIGVRGTDHEPYFVPLGSDVGIPGTYDKVNEGSIFIETPEGTVDIEDRDRAGFAPFAKGSKPTLLDRVPEFFKGSLNEKLLDGRHQKVLDKLEEKLKLRRGGSKPEALEGGGGGGGAGGVSVGVPDIPLPLVPPPILPGGGGVGVPGVPSTGIGATAVEAPAVAPAAPAAPPAEAPAPPPVIDKPSSSAPPAAARPRDGRALPARPRGVPETGLPAARPLDDVTPKDRATQLQEQRLKELKDREIRYEIERERGLLRDLGRESDPDERVLKRNRERR